MGLKLVNQYECKYIKWVKEMKMFADIHLKEETIYTVELYSIKTTPKDI